jgi:hypothetical protein
VAPRDIERVPRRVAAIALALVGLAFVLLVGRWLVQTRPSYAGTNSVAPKYNLAAPKPGQRLCIKDLTLPAAANGLRLRTVTAGSVPAHLRLRLDAGGVRQVARGTAPVGNLGPLDFRFKAPGRDVPAAACLTTDRPLAALSGQPTQGLRTGFSYLDGKPVGAPSMWFLHKPKPRLLSSLSTAAGRASLFRAGFVGAWTYAVIAVLIVLSWCLGLRLMLRAGP